MGDRFPTPRSQNFTEMFMLPDFILEYNGKLYPPKYILSRVSGIDVMSFSGGEETNKIFENLGFAIRNKRETKKRRKEEDILDKVDEILDKINKVGYHNLTDAEKKILSDASQILSGRKD